MGGLNILITIPNNLQVSLEILSTDNDSTSTIIRMKAESLGILETGIKEEMNMVDRVQVMKLVQDALIKGGVAKAWTLSENMMTFDVTGASLSELNQIAAALEQEPIVERCVINTANKGGDDTANVAVSFVIYLTQPAEGGNEQ